MNEAEFLEKLKKAAVRAACDLREVVEDRYKHDRNDENIYPFEVTFTALVFHHLLDNKVEGKNLEVESNYPGARKRMDLHYLDKENKDEYCIEVKTVLAISRERLLYRRRDGITGITEDISRLKELKRQKKIMLVAYLGLDEVDERDFERWKDQIGETGRVRLIFAGSSQPCKHK